MRKCLIIKYLYVIGAFLFVSCNQTEPYISTDRGFIEYQYDYQTVDQNGAAVTKQAFERVTINHAIFVVNTEAVLPDPLSSLNYRQVDLYIYSDDYTGLNAASLGESYVKLQLWDTLANDLNPDKLLPFSYMIRTEAGLLSYIEPACMEFAAKMIIRKDETTDVYSFKNQINGELGKRVYVIDLQNNKYEILATGRFNSKIYNLHYIGEIKKETNTPAFLIH